MKNKWPNYVLSIFVFALITSCGKIKSTLMPSYYFEIGKPYVYKANLKLNLTADAGLLKYSGLMDISADMEIKAIEKNEMGYRILMDIKNLEIKGADSPIVATISLSLNSIKNSLSEFYISEKGKTIVLYNGKIAVGLNSYIQMFFPDLSEFELKKESLYITNFPAKFQKKDYIVVFKKFSRSLDSAFDKLLLQNQIEFLTYPKEDFLSLEEKKSTGNLILNYEDTFGLIYHQLLIKKGNLNMNFSFSVKEGFFTYVIAFQGNGDFEITLQEEII